MFKKLYYNLIIAIKVWLASINPNTFEYALDYRHEHWILDDYKQRLQWHYFGMPQYIKDAFRYKAMWNKNKKEYIEKVLNSDWKWKGLNQCSSSS